MQVSLLNYIIGKPGRSRSMSRHEPLLITYKQTSIRTRLPQHSAHAQSSEVYSAQSFRFVVHARCYPRGQEADSAVCSQLFSRQMFRALSPRWASTLVGCIAVLMIPIPVVLMRCVCSLYETACASSTWIAGMDPL